MRSALLAKTVIGTGVSALLVGFVPAGASHAADALNVPCSSGQAGLVAALNAANASGGGRINLDDGCVYDLTTPSSGLNGLPAVTTPIIINGHDATIDGTNSVRVLEVDGPGGSLTARNLTITGGAADFGGGIANRGGTVTLDRSRVTANSVTLGGGGIASVTFDPSSVAKLTLNNSSVTDNHQTAGPPTGPGVMGGVGGGGVLSILGVTTINRSRVGDNSAMGFVGGGIASGDYLNFSGTGSFLTVNGSQVDDNTAPNAGGGGIQNLLGSVTINNSEVNGNTALNGGGVSSGNGNGGVPPGNSHLVINGSEIDGNTATAPIPVPGPMASPPFAAGGIANGGIATINNSEIEHNTATTVGGGGIVNHGSMTINGSEVNANTAAGSSVLASGGGILNTQGPPGSIDTAVLTLNASQVDNNTAGGVGGGIANGVPAAGPMKPIGGPVTLRHTQVTGNTAPEGGGIFNSGGSISLSANSTVEDNNTDNCEPAGAIAGCFG